MSPRAIARHWEYKNLDWISTSVDAIVVEDKWYTPLETTLDVKAFYLIVEQTNNGATNEDIEVEVTINGSIIGGPGLPVAVSGTAYYMYLSSGRRLWNNAVSTQLLAFDTDQSGPLETKSLQIRVRQTSAVDGVAAQIEVNMVYAQLERSFHSARAHASYEFKNLDWISTSVDAIVVEDKWYTPLETTYDVKAFYLIVEQTNNGAANETIVVELTVNGVVYTESWGGVISGSTYYMAFNSDGGLYYAATSPRQLLYLDPDQSAPLETKSLRIRVRQTTAVDAVAAQIEVNLVYAQRERAR